MKNLKDKTKFITGFTAIILFFAFSSSGFGFTKDFTEPVHKDNYVYVEYKNTMYSEVGSEIWAKTLAEGLVYAYDNSYKDEVLIVGINFESGIYQLYGLEREIMKDFLDGNITERKFLKSIYVITVE